MYSLYMYLFIFTLLLWFLKDQYFAESEIIKILNNVPTICYDWIT